MTVGVADGTVDGETEIVPGGGLAEIAVTVTPVELLLRTMTGPVTAPVGTCTCIEVDVADRRVARIDVLLAPAKVTIGLLLRAHPRHADERRRSPATKCG